MAFGDPQVFETLYNGDLETQSNFDSLLLRGTFDGATISAGAPTGWEFGSGSTAGKTIAAGSRTGGVGTDYYRAQYTAPGTGFLFHFYQVVPLRIHRGLSFGHTGRTFSFRIWARNNGTGTVQIQLTADLLKENLFSASEASQSASAVNLTSTWTLYTMSITPTADFMAAIGVNVNLTVTVDGNPDLQFDEADLYESYTFALNPTVPDDPDFMVPGETFVRTVNNSLLAFGPKDVGSARMRYQMNFGAVGLTQLQALRSFWLLRSPIRWQPKLPHLPTYVQCRIVGKSFPFAMHRGSVNANLYHGALQLEEI